MGMTASNCVTLKWSVHRPKQIYLKAFQLNSEFQIQINFPGRNSEICRICRVVWTVPFALIIWETMSLSAAISTILIPPKLQKRIEFRVTGTAWVVLELIYSKFACNAHTPRHLICLIGQIQTPKLKTSINPSSPPSSTSSYYYYTYIPLSPLCGTADLLSNAKSSYMPSK